MAKLSIHMWRKVAYGWRNSTFCDQSGREVERSWGVARLGEGAGGDGICVLGTGPLDSSGGPRAGPGPLVQAGAPQEARVWLCSSRQPDSAGTRPDGEVRLEFLFSNQREYS